MRTHPTIAVSLKLFAWSKFVMLAGAVLTARSHT